MVLIYVLMIELGTNRSSGVSSATVEMFTPCSDNPHENKLEGYEVKAGSATMPKFQHILKLR